MRHLILTYALADFLEMHFSKDPKLIKAVGKKILPKLIQSGTLHHTPAFALKNTLVAVQNSGTARQATEIVILNPGDQSFQKYQLRPLFD